VHNSNSNNPFIRGIVINFKKYAINNVIKINNIKRYIKGWANGITSIKRVSTTDIGKVLNSRYLLSVYKKIVISVK
jgi:hypothetical protein